MSDVSAKPDRSTGTSKPPPPPPPGPIAATVQERSPRWPVGDDVQEKVVNGRPVGFRFDAELDVAEIDDRGRPGPVWTAKGRSVSRSNLVFRSRRMCYTGRTVLAAVHLIDDKPVALMGCVQACEYDGEGQYRVDVDLLPVPDDPVIQSWLIARG